MVKKTKKLSICEEIVFQILTKLPVKSLFRFRCVSKDWLRLIEDPYFVNRHRECSHTRPGGIRVLSGHDSFQIDDEFLSCYLQDPEGNSDHQTELVPLPSKFSLDPSRVSNAEGLICFGNRVWNPSTREKMYFPHAKHCSYRMLNKHYLLGFDAFTNKYKVVCIWTCNARKITGKNLANQAPSVQVLTLGENEISWKRIPSIPKELRKGFEILSFRSFSNTIFCVVRCGIKEKFGVLTFDVQRENVGFISSRGMFEIPKNEFPIHLAEIEGRLAFQGIGRTLWVLNHEIADWTKMEITIPGCLNVLYDLWFDFIFDGNDYIKARLIPLGTFHTNEIMFQCHVEENGWREGRLFKYFYYDPETKKVRFVPKFERNVGGSREYMMFKHVDSLVRLKPLRKRG